jgi:hypothetical protein
VVHVTGVEGRRFRACLDHRRTVVNYLQLWCFTRKYPVDARACTPATAAATARLRAPASRRRLALDYSWNGNIPHRILPVFPTFESCSPACEGPAAEGRPRTHGRTGRRRAWPVLGRQCVLPLPTGTLKDWNFHPTLIGQQPAALYSIEYLAWEIPVHVLLILSLLLSAQE